MEYQEKLRMETFSFAVRGIWLVYIFIRRATSFENFTSAPHTFSNQKLMISVNVVTSSDSQLFILDKLSIKVEISYSAIFGLHFITGDKIL